MEIACVSLGWIYVFYVEMEEQNGEPNTLLMVQDALSQSIHVPPYNCFVGTK